MPIVSQEDVEALSVMKERVRDTRRSFDRIDYFLGMAMLIGPAFAYYFRPDWSNYVIAALLGALAVQFAHKIGIFGDS